jgi:uncharacterized protein (DUF58 family)
MRAPLQPIDARGGLRVAGLGVALLIAAAVFDCEPLFVPAAALLALALLAAAWVALGATGSWLERTVTARRVVEDEPVHGRLRARGGPLGLIGAVVEDPLLGSGAWPLEGRGRDAALSIDARFRRRGRRDLAPPALIFADPIGLVRVRRVATGAPVSVLVLPRLEPVVAAGRVVGGDGTGAGGRRAGGGAAEVELDGLRPAQPGTPAARIHWPALARGAGLQERRLRSESDARPLVALDARTFAGEEALDAAVRATASLAVHLARHGGCALLLPGDRRPTVLDVDLHGWSAQHVRLALLEGGHGPAPSALATRHGPVLLVLAHVPARAPRALAASPSAKRILVVPGAMPGRRVAFAVAGCSAYELARVAEAVA